MLTLLHSDGNAHLNTSQVFTLWAYKRYAKVLGRRPSTYALGWLNPDLYKKVRQHFLSVENLLPYLPKADA
jgi:hypothetical protein